MSLAALKKKLLENPDVKAEHDKLEAEYSLASQLIKLRKKAGLTQEQLAVKMGTQKSNISRLERGHRNTTWHTITKYAEACGIPANSLRIHIEE